MKFLKYTFLTLSALFIVNLSSCSYFLKHDYTITNNSSFNLAFKVKNYGEDIYSVNSGDSIELSLYDSPTLIFPNNERVAFYGGADEGEIKNLECYEYKIENTSSKTVILSETKNMLGDTYGTTVELESSDTQTVNVYTQAPNWSAYYKDDETADALSVLTFEQQ